MAAPIVIGLGVAIFGSGLVTLAYNIFEDIRS